MLCLTNRWSDSVKVLKRDELEMWTKHVDDGRLLWLFTPQSHRKNVSVYLLLSKYATEPLTLAQPLGVVNTTVHEENVSENLSYHCRGSEHLFHSIRDIARALR